MHVRLQTWLPFQIKVVLNGRDWLARQLDAAGIGCLKKDNTFVALDDFGRAQALLDAQLQVNMPGKGDGTVRKWGADEPKIRLQLVNCDRLTSDRFVRQPSIEPSPGSKPRLQNLEEWPTAFCKNQEESRKGKSDPKQTALPPYSPGRPALT